MGRNCKNILTPEGIDRRDKGYYSTPSFISQFITEVMLKINPKGEYVLDPAVGKEELLYYFFNAGKKIDSFDIYNYGNYKYSNFRLVDFIEYYCNLQSQIIFNQQINLKYDYYIANPPYNCHEIDYIRNNKRRLNGIFDDIGTHNMYSMFLAGLIDCAKDGSLIGMIILDSFLTAKMHEGLRKKILENCSIHYLVLCPTDLFLNQKADVRTCIIILQKGTKYQNKVQVSNRPENKNSLKTLLENKDFTKKNINDINLKGNEDSFEFIIECSPEIRRLFDFPRLGDLFNCITGISTGDDTKYISKEKNDYYSIPFYKNPGMRRFYTTPDGFLPNDFLEIEGKIKNFMVRNKKLLFKEGITCSSMGVSFGACYLPPNSTYGVNANIICSEKEIWWLLSYLNSSIVSYIVRSCLIRSNMITSGYVSRIPIPSFSENIKNELSQISKEAYEKKVSKNNADIYIDKIDQIIFKYLNISDDGINEIICFTSNLLKAV